MYFNFDKDSISRHVHFKFLSRRLNPLHKCTLTTYSQEKTVWNSFESIMVKQRIQCSRITDFHFNLFIIQFYSDWVVFVGRNCKGSSLSAQRFWDRFSLLTLFFAWVSIFRINVRAKYSWNLRDFSFRLGDSFFFEECPCLTEKMLYTLKLFRKHKNDVQEKLVHFVETGMCIYSRAKFAEKSRCTNRE